VVQGVGVWGEGRGGGEGFRGGGRAQHGTPLPGRGRPCPVVRIPMTGPREPIRPML